MSAMNMHVSGEKQTYEFIWPSTKYSGVPGREKSKNAK
jgi:hypothetical protein